MGRSISPHKKHASNRKNSHRALLISVSAVVFAAMFTVFVNGVPVLALINSTSIEGIEFYSNLSRDHVDGDVSYTMNPPVGGSHSPVPQNCGIYDHVISNEHAVHSLEHGAVWITYEPGLAEEEVAKLQSLVEPYSYTLLSPYQPNLLDTPIVAVAWGIRLELQEADDPRLSQFVQNYVQGPQTPEPGERCVGGVS